MADLKSGDRIRVQQYEPMAILDGATTGQKVGVVHNGSSHMLVVLSDLDAAVNNMEYATFLQSFPYYDQPEEGTPFVYAQALLFAVGEALAR